MIVHHGRTGRTAASAAIGWDRGAFARGSKALHASVRAALNIAPGAGDDPASLVVACGKSNDARPFDPFAVRLDDASMTYKPDKDFDLETWRDEVGQSGRRGPRGITPREVVAALRDGGGRMKRSELVAAVVATTGKHQASAYRAVSRATDEGVVGLENGECVLVA